MNSPRTKFYKDKQNAKWAGVCAGIADYTGIDVNIIRTAFVLGTVFTGGSVLLAYFIIAWMVPDKPGRLYEKTREDKQFWQKVRSNPRRVARVAERVRARRGWHHFGNERDTDRKFTADPKPGDEAIEHEIADAPRCRTEPGTQRIDENGDEHRACPADAIAEHAEEQSAAGPARDEQRGRSRRPP